MLNISAIILTYNEELHIRRCLENVNTFAKEVFVVDCFSTDTTKDICKELGATLIEHPWPGNQAAQFNWALSHLDIKTEWILRLDADEYLMPELKEELCEKLPSLPDDVTGVVMKRRVYFMGKWMRRGTYPVKLLRIFRYGKAICEQRLMDEHIQLLEGTSVEMESDFCDHNLHDVSWFCQKHINYAIREAAELLDIEFNMSGRRELDSSKQLGEQAEKKRARKHSYAKQPLFWRAFAYFCYRYFIMGACLEGKEGFLWTFFQGWWYRTLVDAKVYEIKKTCGMDKDRVVRYLKDKYQIDISRCESC